MRAWDLISLLDPKVIPDQTKIHLAVHNSYRDPLDVYLAGEFAEWQASQSRKNFERRFVVALIQLPARHSWLFAGAYSAHGYTIDAEGRHIYRLRERRGCAEINGRLVVHFQRPGRQSYVYGEKFADEITLEEIRREPLRVPMFPGFKALHVTKPQLDLIVRENHDSWRAALSSVAGVYLITDTETGRFYVGSATGEGGLWQRWANYSNSGHGGNRELKALVGSEARRADAFKFSILEITDVHESADEVKARESHWKSVLLTRIHGFNAN